MSRYDIVLPSFGRPFDGDYLLSATRSLNRPPENFISQRGDFNVLVEIRSVSRPFVQAE